MDRSIDIAGIKTTPATGASLRRHLTSRMLDPGVSGHLVSSLNLHALALAHKDSTMRSFFDLCDLVYIDGMPVVVWARLLGHRVRREHRATAVDWLPNLLEEMARLGLRWFHIGGRSGVVSDALRGMRAKGLLSEAPDFRDHSGYFDHDLGSSDCDEIFCQISSFKPHLVTIGMGMPLQEVWTKAAIGKMEAKVVLVIGATLDCFSGDQPYIPRYLANLGMEGVVRLMASPRRLFVRYMVEPFSLMAPFMRDIRSRRG